MKKVLLVIGALVLLFLLSFFCSYGIYKKTTGYSDASEKQAGIRDYLTLAENQENKTQASDAKTEAPETVEAITKKQKETKQTDASNRDAEETAEAEYNFLVSDLNGYIAVFTDTGSLYEFTDIKLDSLESDVRKRVKNGIKFQKAKELFTFLESCSS